MPLKHDSKNMTLKHHAQKHAAKKQNFKEKFNSEVEPDPRYFEPETLSSHP